MHCVKGTRPEPAVSPWALMDRMTVTHMGRLSLSFGVVLSLEFILPDRQAPLTGNAVAYACSQLMSWVIARLT